MDVELTQLYLLWKATNSRELSFKDAFIFKSKIGQQLHWSKTIWSPYTPPSKYMLAWRIMHA